MLYMWLLIKLQSLILLITTALLYFAIGSGIAAASEKQVNKFNDGIRSSVYASGNIVNVTWQYDRIPPAPVRDIEATFDGASLKPVRIRTYPYKNSTTAVLFLIDVSDPSRQNAVERAAIAITKILAQAKAHHRFGLAEFDSELRLLRPLPSTATAVIDALAGLKAKGQTTELYRSLRDAVSLLARVKAERRAIFLFSDGGAEDKGYGLKDVVEPAQKAGINIYGIGYPPSKKSQEVSLSVLRNLAEKTNGLFVRAEKPQLKLPFAFTIAPFALLEGGGRASFSAARHFRLPFVTPSPVEVKILYGPKTLFLRTTVDLPLPSFKQWKHIFVTDRFRPYVIWLAFVTGVGLIALIAIIIFTTRRTARARQKTAPVAYLEFLDSTEKRFPIAESSLRIGRSDDNEVVIPNTSVSAHHASLHRQRDGTFIINDLGSSNGILVNGDEVTEANLNKDDIIELGEVRLRFVFP